MAMGFDGPGQDASTGRLHRGLPFDREADNQVSKVGTPAQEAVVPTGTDAEGWQGGAGSWPRHRPSARWPASSRNAPSMARLDRAQSGQGLRG